MMNKWLKTISVLLLAAALLPTASAEERTERHVVIYFQDGSRVNLPASIAEDPQALSDYCSTYFPGRRYTKTAWDAAFQYDATIAETWVAAKYGDGSRAMSARLLQLGLVNSVVETIQGEQLTVPTRFLTLHGNEDLAHHVAIINAPRTGQASLREKANGSSTVVDQCKAGRIVAVMEYGNTSYTKIMYEGKAGYIRTDCLIFFDGEKTPLGRATVQGREAVAVQAAADQGTAKVTELAAGAVVTVHGQEAGWYAVEFDGWFGYMQEQFLRMEE